MSLALNLPVFFLVPKEDYTPQGTPHAKSNTGLVKFDYCGSIDCFKIYILDNFPVVEEVEYFNFTLDLANDGSKYAELLDTTGGVFILPRRTWDSCMNI